VDGEAAVGADGSGASARDQSRLRDGATAVVLAALPLRLVLALSTDLSPDEAYYLCAARQPGLAPPMPDHPPLLAWLLRLGDGLPLPLELRVRIWPLLLSTALGFMCVELARRQGANRSARLAAAWLGSWSLLPMAGGFVATPDGPALLSCAVLLWWTTAGASEPGHASGAARAGSARVAIDFAAGLAALLGTLAKVVIAPIAALVALASARPVAVRAAIAFAPWVALPWLLPSLRFQARHALGQPAGAAWHVVDAAGAMATAAVAQLALWSPWVVAVGIARCWRAARPAPRSADPRNLRDSMPRAHVLVVGLFTALVSTSALVRAVPPEPNWWAPAAVVVLVAAALRAGQLAPTRRAVMLATAVLPTIVVATHVAKPWLPLPLEVDPTARLHGWSTDRPPLQAPGIGVYGAAAERCVYRADCQEIQRYFEDMKQEL
jgi:hypothetical protein